MTLEITLAELVRRRLKYLPREAVLDGPSVRGQAGRGLLARAGRTWATLGSHGSRLAHRDSETANTSRVHLDYG